MIFMINITVFGIKIFIAFVQWVVNNEKNSALIQMSNWNSAVQEVQTVTKCVLPSTLILLRNSVCMCVCVLALELGRSVNHESDLSCFKFQLLRLMPMETEESAVPRQRPHLHTSDASSLTPPWVFTIYHLLTISPNYTQSNSHCCITTYTVHLCFNDRWKLISPPRCFFKTFAVCMLSAAYCQILDFCNSDWKKKIQNNLITTTGSSVSRGLQTPCQNKQEDMTSQGTANSVIQSQVWESHSPTFSWHILCIPAQYRAL